MGCGWGREWEWGGWSRDSSHLDRIGIRGIVGAWVVGLGVLVCWMTGATFVMGRNGWMEGWMGVWGLLSATSLLSFWVIHIAFVFGGVYFPDFFEFLPPSQGRLATVPQLLIVALVMIVLRSYTIFVPA